MRTFPGCSRRTGRSKPGVEDALPRTKATAVVFWAVKNNVFIGRNVNFLVQS